MKNLSRREFLKTAAAGAAGIAAMGAVGASAAEEGVVLSASVMGNNKWDFEIPPAPIDESLITKTIEHDIIIVGSGLSGLCTAVSAQEMGADVLVFSASSRPISRGGSNHAIGSKVQLAKGIDYTPNSDSCRHAVKMEVLSASSVMPKKLS